MSSLFDTLVRNRRNQTPWAKMSVVSFLTEAAWSGAPWGNRKEAAAASISVVYRPDVASRLWWTIRWMGEDGEMREASAQELDLAAWRAAEIELSHRKAESRVPQCPTGPEGEPGPAGVRVIGPEDPQ